MKLHFRETGTGKPLIILHGLFGFLDNWQTLAKYFAQHYHVYLVDLRNHGRSPHSPDFNYPLMAADLLEFINEHHISEPVIMGHSMGGKVAMHFALHHPEKLSKLIVVDMAPKSYPPHHQDILAGLKAVDLKAVTTRGEIDEALARHIPEEGVRQFLAKNLYRQEDNTFAWRMNLPVIEEKITEVGKETTSQLPFLKPALFIRGANSRYIKPEKDMDLIQKLFPAATLETIADAGHWVHAEKPQELFNQVVNFIEKA
jgi:pimeloyl-ACP methyl ester carboxylesterase